MTADDPAQKKQALAVLTMIQASFKISRHFKVCPTCLVYATAKATQAAEERGDAVHGMCDTSEFIHRPHKTAKRH